MALTQQDKEEMFQYLITRGKGLGSLDEGDSNLSNKYLAPVLEYSGGTASKAVRLAVSLLQGKSAVLRKSGDLVQWQLQGASTWETLYSMADYKGLPGANGKNPVFRKNSTSLEYKLDGEEDTAYKLLVALSEITGPEGDHVVLRVQDGKLEYKQSKAADSTYQLLVALSDITGPQGRPGKDFQILGYYETIADLRTAITSPEPGEAYGVGTAAPYPIYIWDAVSRDWVNNGAIQGPAGRSGKSARVNTDTGYWEEFDDNTQTWKQTEALGVYNIATSEKDGLMSKDDKAKLDQMKGGDIEVSKANIEKVFTGNITTHTHDTERIVSGMPTDVWDGVTVSTALAGSGTVDDPYLIQSCADYIHFYRNPNLYSHDVDMNMGPTVEQKGNPKQIKFTSHLDFNNHLLNFESTVLNPDQSSGPEDIVKALILAQVDGQGCNLSNINFLNTWAVIPFSMYCAIKNIHVTNGVFTIPLSFIHDKELSGTDQILLSPWGLVLGYSHVEDISFVAEIKFTGDIATSIMFVPGATIITMISREIPGLTIGEKPYFYSYVTYTCDNELTNLVGIQHAPAYINKGDSSVVVTGYDYTKTHKDSQTLPTQGLGIAMLIVGFSDSPYTMYINSDNALPFDGNDSFHIAKTTAEMKSPEFLALLNGDTETFVADTDNINDGYPIFKPNQTVQTYDGYVKESTFEAFKNNMPAGGSGNVYNLDIDISGEISKLDANMQKLAWGKTYTAPTNDNIVELLGGTEGIRQLCEKLAPANNPVVTVPFLAYVFPSTLISSAVLINTLNSAGNESVPLVDGCRINIMLQFQVNIDKPSNITVSISITNFNTSTQTAAYSFSLTEQSSGQTTEVLDILTSTNSNAALSANQGRVLKGLIDNFSGTTVVNNLTSTSTTSALSAAQGKALKTLVDGKVGSSEITTIKKLTQSAYDALSSKDSKTLYIIV